MEILEDAPSPALATASIGEVDLLSAPPPSGAAAAAPVDAVPVAGDAAATEQPKKLGKVA